jgi:hypothetical protein
MPMVPFTFSVIITDDPSPIYDISERVFITIRAPDSFGKTPHLDLNSTTMFICKFILGK